MAFELGIDTGARTEQSPRCTTMEAVLEFRWEKVNWELSEVQRKGSEDGGMWWQARECGSEVVECWVVTTDFQSELLQGRWLGCRRGYHRWRIVGCACGCWGGRRF